MKTTSQKRKQQNEVTAKIKIKQENSSQQSNVAEDVIDGARPNRRGRPPKIASQVARNPIVPRAMSPPISPKKNNVEEEANEARRIQAETFVMKLFDRSLDLSKYTENTSLYPICRAWMANQPRNPSIRSYLDRRSPSPDERKDNSGEILAKLKSGELKELHIMPKPKKAEIPKIPILKKSKTMKDSEELLKLNDAFQNITKEELLAQHLAKWKEIKRDWIKHMKQYQQRNELNYLIIEQLFKP